MVTSSGSAVIWKEADVCPSVKSRTPTVGVTSRAAEGVVTSQATETSVNVPLSLMTVKVVVEGRVWSEGLRGGSAVCVCVCVCVRERERESECQQGCWRNES